MLTAKPLGQEDIPDPNEIMVPGQVDATAEAAAAAEARRKNLVLVGGLSLLGVVVVGAAALMYTTRESRSHIDRHPLRAGQHRCISHIRYRVVNDYGKLKRIGTC